MWFVGQAVKTSPSHGENRGSIPLRTALFFIKQPNPKGTAGNRCCLQYFFVIKKTFVLDILFDRHCERSINMAVIEGYTEYLQMMNLAKGKLSNQRILNAE